MRLDRQPEVERRRVHASDQLGTLTLETIKPIELCIPSVRLRAGGN